MVQLAFYLGTKRENPHARILDRVICWWSGRWERIPGRLLPRRVVARFSHVEFIERWHGGETWAACWAASNREGDVRKTALDVKNGRWVILSVPRRDYQRLLAHFQARKGQSYGWICAAAHIFPRVLRPLVRAIGGNEPYCSSIIADGLGFSDPWIAPQKLYDSLVGRA